MNVRLRIPKLLSDLVAKQLSSKKVNLLISYNRLSIRGPLRQGKCLGEPFHIFGAKEKKNEHLLFTSIGDHVRWLRAGLSNMINY